MRVAAIILAAGASRRLGRSKQLLTLEGETLLHRTARIAWESGLRPVRVVLGADAEIHREALAGLDIHVIQNPEWEEGMGSSLRAGVAELPPEVEAALLLVCDQPALDGALLGRILAAHEATPERVVAAHYAGICGIPALFPRSFFPKLGVMCGDKGARSLLREGEAVEVAFPGGELDLDVPADLERFRR